MKKREGNGEKMEREKREGGTYIKKKEKKEKTVESEKRECESYI